MSDHLGVDGRMIRVRSCTEKHGVWIEVWRGTGQEPIDYLFIPGDMKDDIARDMIGTRCEIGGDDNG